MSMVTRMRGVWLAALVGAVVWSAGASLSAQGPAAPAPAQAPHMGGEANLVLPDLGTVTFQGVNGRTLLLGGLAVCVLGSAVRPADQHAAEEPAGASVDARDL